MPGDHDAKMDALAIRIGRELEGEDLFDVAAVCAKLICFSIREGFDGSAHQQEALEKIIAFMRQHSLEGEQ